MNFRQILPAITMIAAILRICSAQSTFSNTCPGGHAFPFASIAVKHPVDQSCGTEGLAASPLGSHAQNKVKNNFCAQGTPEVFTPQMLIDLQGRTHVPAGPSSEPADRAAMTSLGEGKLVMVKAFIIEAHHADVGSGESVNCKLKNEEGNDIHIALGPAATTQECASVSAEISPHFRPASWNEIGHFEKFDTTTHRNVVNTALAALLQAQPFRFTGQLFFDASHATCPCGTNCNPKRSSDWEIHPIYNIEVCKTGTLCDVRSNTDWTPFDTWWQSLHNPAKPHTHVPHEKK